jgi:hypothetical protein
MLSPWSAGPAAQVDSKLSEELLRQEVTESLRSCLEAAQSDAADARSSLTTQLRDLRSDHEGRISAAAAAATEGTLVAGERVAAVGAALAAHVARTEGAAGRLAEGVAALRADADRLGDQQRVSSG